MKRLAAVFVFSTLYSVFAFSQCSDAGACAISHRVQSARHQIGLSLIFGTSGQPDDLIFQTIRLESDLTIFEDSRLTFEIPYSFQSGPLGTNDGVGDLILLWNQALLHREASSLVAHFGAKISVGGANSNNLPQAYQSTLGTNDILLGLTFNYSAWNASAVYQISRGRSKNTITELKRGDDLLVRTGYGFTLPPAILIAELLAIKRLEESSVRNTGSGSPEIYYDLPNSNQFQVNLQVRTMFPLSEGYTLQLLAALPLLNRDVNVDGLKRSFSFSVGISHLF